MPARRFHHLAEGSQRPALRDEARSWRYADLLAEARRYAAAFHRAGLRPGDRVAALVQPQLELVAALLGAHLAELVFVPIHPGYRWPEVEHVLHDCTPARLLVDATTRAIVPDGGPAAASVESLAVQLEGLPRLDDRKPSDPPPLPWAVDPSAVALLVYTSGTTGRSKGVAISHGAIERGIGALTDLWAWSERDVLSLMLPLFHVHGLCIGALGGLMHGMEIMLHPRFSPAAVVEDFARRGATIFMGVPTMYSRLLEHLERSPADGAVLAQARLFTAGSAALPADDLERFERHTGHRILERYGMTETLLTASNPYEGERRPGSVGLPVPGVSVRIVDDDGTDLPYGPGELWVKTPGIMDGYWGRPEETAAAFDGEWFRTGDVVTRDPDGYLRVIGRSSIDIIKSGGFKIGAREIEDVLSSHPWVREVAVFGVPDPTWGELVAAAIVPAPGAPADPALAEGLAAHCDRSLAAYKRPRAWRRVDALPRNALGKVQKTALKAALASST